MSGHVVTFGALMDSIKTLSEELIGVHPQFIATLAHELRNPLNSLSGVGTLLSRNPRPDTLLWMGGAVNRQVERLSDIIDMVSDASRIARGSFSIKTDICDLHGALTEALLPLQESLQERGVSLQTGIPQPEMMVVKGDPRRLRRICSSIIENYIRYCPRGSTFKVVVGIGEANVVEIRFQDSGPGFPESERSLLSGADPYRALFQRAKPGTLGISLLVARATCEFLHGSLSVESPAGGGALVSVKLPRAA